MKTQLIISTYKVSAEKADMLPAQGCAGNVSDTKADRTDFLSSHFQAYHPTQFHSLLLLHFLRGAHLFNLVFDKQRGLLVACPLALFN